MPNEVEIKFKLKDPQVIRDKLASLQAEFIKKEPELDLFFDDQADNVRKKGNALRVRKNRENGVITFKGPGQKDANFKVREEIEAEVADPDKLIAILQKIGYRLVGVKEKEREIFKLKEVLVLIDRLPFIGYYLEIEGERDRIFEAVKSLELDMNDSSKATYSNLFSTYVHFLGPKFEAKGIKPAFTFECEKLFNSAA